MKTTAAILFLALLPFQVFSQGFDTIKVTKDIELVKISPAAYVHISYMNMANYGRVPANGLILVNNNEAFLFDTPWTDSLTTILVNYIQDNMLLKIIGFITSDWHWDSMGGLKVINDLGVPTYANEMTRDIAITKGLPLPNKVFNDSTHIPFGNNNIDCYYIGAAHTMDNIVTWIPSEKILFTDCMMKEVKATNLGFTDDGDVKSYPATVTKVKDKFKTAKFIIPGHGNIGGVELIDHTLELTKNK